MCLIELGMPAVRPRATKAAVDGTQPRVKQKINLDPASADRLRDLTLAGLTSSPLRSGEDWPRGA